MPYKGSGKSPVEEAEKEKADAKPEPPRHAVRLLMGFLDRRMQSRRLRLTVRRLRLPPVLARRSLSLCLPLSEYFLRHSYGVGCVVL